MQLNLAILVGVPVNGGIQGYNMAGMRGCAGTHVAFSSSSLLLESCICRLDHTSILSILQ